MENESRRPTAGVRVARWVFGLAGVYGLLVMLPAYIRPELTTGGLPVTMPEFFYGFVGVVVTWQVVFLLIAADPLRYRPLMLVAAVGEKGLFVVAMTILLAKQRVPLRWAGPVGVDALLGLGFVVGYWATRNRERCPEAAAVSRPPP